MIRTSIPVLVDSALSLSDLEPSQLVLFIQSFGIPVDSMTKLLQTLDTPVTADSPDPEAVSLIMVRDYQTQITCRQVSASVLDKAYMGQLVAVQHNRGAEGGRVFARALDLDLNLASNQVR